MILPRSLSRFFPNPVPQRDLATEKFEPLRLYPDVLIPKEIWEHLIQANTTAIRLAAEDPNAPGHDYDMDSYYKGALHLGAIRQDAERISIYESIWGGGEV